MAWEEDPLYTFLISFGVSAIVTAIFCCAISTCLITCVCIIWRRKSRQSQYGVLTDEEEQAIHDHENTIYYSRNNIVTTNTNSGKIDRKIAQQQMENASIHARIILRSYPQFRLVKNVSDLGKFQQIVFLLKEKSGQQFLLAISENQNKFPCLIETENEKLVFLFLMKNLKHLNLYPIYDVDFVIAKGQCIIFREFSERGSLKDLIYKSKPLDTLEKKYGIHLEQSKSKRNTVSQTITVTPLGAVASNERQTKRGEPLSTQMIAIYARQILDALKALQTIGMRFPHLSTSNIMTFKPPNTPKYSPTLTLQISELEKVFLGMEPEYAPFFSPLNQYLKEEVIAFGHVLYEMATGRELNAPDLSKDTLYKQTCAQPVQQILEKIFQCKEKDAITIDTLLCEGFFVVTVYDHQLVPDAMIKNPLQTVESNKEMKKNVALLFEKLEKRVRETNGFTELVSSQHETNALIIRKKQNRQSSILSSSITNSGITPLVNI